LTEKILVELKLDLESLRLVPGKGGRFEVFVDDEKIYSKLDTGAFPDENAVLGEIVKRSR
jgi:selenoprotein W-related protein